MIELEVGNVIDRYKVEGTLGQGGMAIVYRVRHQQLGTLHALKILMIPARSIRERLLQEGRVQAALKHPNIVNVTDVVDVNGAPGLVMEFVAGPSLDEMLQERRLTIEQADVLGRGIIEGVQVAHEAGMIHRDLKPGNILLSVYKDALIPKITDFGLAKLMGDDASGAAHRTRSGVAMGTPHYMAPEQIRNAKGVDERADIFSLGAVLYELVTTQRAFEGEDTFEIFSQVTSGKYRSIEEIQPDCPQRMIDTIRAALEVDREKRVQSCTELIELWTGKASSAPVARGPWEKSLIDRAGEMGSGDDAPLPSSFGSGGSGGSAEATMDFGAASVADTGVQQHAAVTAPEPSSVVSSAPVSAPAVAPVFAPAVAPVSAPAVTPVSTPAVAPLSMPPPAPSLASRILPVAVLLIGLLTLLMGGAALITAVGVVMANSSTEEAAPVVDPVKAPPQPVQPPEVEPEPIEAAPEQPATPAPTPTPTPTPAPSPGAPPQQPAPVDPPPRQPAPAPVVEAPPTPEPPPAEHVDTDIDVVLDTDIPVPEPPAGSIPVDLRVRYHPMTPGAEAMAKAWLVGEDGVRTQLPGLVMPGDYLIEAAFNRKGSPIQAGRLKVSAGNVYRVSCYTAIKECRS